MAIETAEGGDDIVEGEFRAPRRVVVTVGEAASEYFDWSEKRERRAQKLAESGEAAPPSRKASLPFDKNARSAVTQFVSHVTPGLPIAELTSHGMAAFQETIGTNAADVAARLLPVKEFLRFCWNRRYIEANLGNHLRVKTAAAVSASAQIEHEEAERFEMTAEGLQRLKEELERHREEMPAAIQAVTQARADGKVSKNAPLEAARENQERLNSRINELKYQIAHAVIIKGDTDGRARLGSTVGVRRLDAGGGQVQQYTLVGPTEVNASSAASRSKAPSARGWLTPLSVQLSKSRFRVARCAMRSCLLRDDPEACSAAASRRCQGRRRSGVRACTVGDDYDDRERRRHR